MTEIRLRAVEPEDVDFMLECEADGEASKWTDYRAPMSRTQLMTYALTYDADPFGAGQLRLIAETPEGDRVGIADLYDISERDGRAFIGVTIHPDKRRLGLGANTLDAVQSFANSRMGLRQLCAKVSVKNLAATELFAKAGYEQLCILPDWHKIGTDFHDFRLLVKKI